MHTFQDAARILCFTSINNFSRKGAKTRRKDKKRSPRSHEGHGERQRNFNTDGHGFSQIKRGYFCVHLWQIPLLKLPYPLILPFAPWRLSEMPFPLLKKLRALRASSEAGGKNSLRLGVLARDILHLFPEHPFLRCAKNHQKLNHN